MLHALLEEGSLAICEETPDGVLLRPAVALVVERYSPERKAELLLNNATGARDYAVRAVTCAAIRSTQGTASSVTLP